jgi:hypothetical protein
MKRLLLLVLVAISTAVGAQTPIKKITVETPGYQITNVNYTEPGVGRIDLMDGMTFDLGEKWVFDFEKNIIYYSSNYWMDINDPTSGYKEQMKMSLVTIDPSGLRFKVIVADHLDGDRTYSINTEKNTFNIFSGDGFWGEYVTMQKHQTVKITKN